MIVNLIIVVFVLILSVVFALQNSTVVTLKFFKFSTTQSLAMILVVSFLLGIIITLILMIPYYFRYRKKTSQLKREIKELSSKIEELRVSNETSEGAIEKEEE